MSRVGAILLAIGLACGIYYVIPYLRDYKSPLAKKITEGLRKAQEQRESRCPEPKAAP